jgi:hypothetical protein
MRLGTLTRKELRRRAADAPCPSRYKGILPRERLAHEAISQVLLLLPITLTLRFVTLIDGAAAHG